MYGVTIYTGIPVNPTASLLKLPAQVEAGGTWGVEKSVSVTEQVSMVRCTLIGQGTKGPLLLAMQQEALASEDERYPWALRRDVGISP